MIDPDEIVEQHAAQVSRRACSGRAVLHLGLIGLRVGAELLEIVHRQVLARDEHDWDLGDKRPR